MGATRGGEKKKHKKTNNLQRETQPQKGRESVWIGTCWSSSSLPMGLFTRRWWNMTCTYIQPAEKAQMPFLHGPHSHDWVQTELWCCKQSNTCCFVSSVMGKKNITIHRRMVGFWSAACFYILLHLPVTSHHQKQARWQSLVAFGHYNVESWILPSIFCPKNSTQ